MKRFTRVPFNTATLAGIFRRALKEYDRVHGRVTKRNVVPYIKVTEYLKRVKAYSGKVGE